MVPQARVTPFKTAILTGPTASGKSSIALDFARAARKAGIEMEIINADSIAVYRGFDIGSAKPTKAERTEIPHHLIDVLDPNEFFAAPDFAKRVERTLAEIHARGARALVVGGTGFYIKALVYGVWDAPPTSDSFRQSLENQSNAELHARLKTLDPASADRIPPNDRYRVVRALEIHALSGKKASDLARDENRAPDPRYVHLHVDREPRELEARIHARTQAMLDQGLVEETRALRTAYPRARALTSVGYAQVIHYLDGVQPDGRKVASGLAGLRDEIALATRQLVKSQRTWFKGQAEAEEFTLDTDREKLLERLTSIYQAG